MAPYFAYIKQIVCDVKRSKDCGNKYGYSHSTDMIPDKEFVLLYDLYTSKN